jgi:hypothetical protein
MGWIRRNRKGLDNLFLALLAIIALPGLPLLLEKIFTGGLQKSSVMLCACIYVITLGITSKVRSFFFATIICCALLSGAYTWEVDHFPATAGEANDAAGPSPGGQPILEQSALKERDGPVNKAAGTEALLVEISWYSIGVAAFIHLIERFTRHVLAAEAVFEWEE